MITCMYLFYKNTLNIFQWQILITERDTHHPEQKLWIYDTKYVDIKEYFESNFLTSTKVYKVNHFSKVGQSAANDHKG